MSFPKRSILLTAICLAVFLGNVAEAGPEPAIQLIGAAAERDAQGCIFLRVFERNTLTPLWFNLEPQVLAEGDTALFVGGYWASCSGDSCPFAEQCLYGADVLPNQAFDFGCGTFFISDVEGCKLFNSPDYGWLEVRTDTGELPDLGEPVRVIGHIFFGGVTFCPSPLIIKAEGIIFLCDDPISTQLRSWGSLKTMYR